MGQSYPKMCKEPSVSFLRPAYQSIKHHILPLSEFDYFAAESFLAVTTFVSSVGHQEGGFAVHLHLTSIA